MAEKKKGTVRNFLKRHSFIVVFVVALLIALTNYMVYPIFISKDLDLSEIPIAKDTIAEGTLITEEMLSSVSISAELLPPGIYLSKDAIIGMYVGADTSIPKGGFFYDEQLSIEEDAMGSIHSKLVEGEFAYAIPLEERYFQDDSLKEGQYVDFFFYTYEDIEEDSGTTFDAPVFGMLAKGVRVLSISGGEGETYVTVALSEENLSYFQIAEQWNVKNGGSIYPLLNFSSDGLSEDESLYYNEDALHAWLKAHSNVFENSEEIKAAKYIERYGVSTSEIEAEIITDGGED